MLALTFKWGNGLQDAKLLENSHEKNDDHSDGQQLHVLDAHDFQVTWGILVSQFRPLRGWTTETPESQSLTRLSQKEFLKVVSFRTWAFRLKKKHEKRAIQVEDGWTPGWC